MIKKLIIMVVALMPWLAQAQVAVGEWTLYPTSGNVENLAETNAYVYFTSGGTLVCVDKSTGEVQRYDVTNRLNDSNITGVFVDADSRSIIIAYASGNLDRLYDNGKMVNMSDIKDAIMTDSRTINDMAFGKENIYVATDFGLVTLSNAKNEVRETALTTSPVRLVFVCGDAVGTLVGNEMRVAPQSARITSYDKLLTTNYSNGTYWIDIEGGAGKYAMLTQKYGKDHQLYSLSVDLDAATVDLKHISLGNNEFLPRLSRNKNGEVYAISTDGTVTLDETGAPVVDDKVKKITKNPSDASDKTVPVLSYYSTPDKVWAGYTSTVQQLDFTGSAPATAQIIQSGSGLTLNVIYDMDFDAEGNLLLHDTAERLSLDYSATGVRKMNVNRMVNGIIENITPKDVVNKQNTWSKDIIYAFRIKAHPTESDVYLASTFYDGLHVVKDGESIVSYFTDNSTFRVRNSKVQVACSDFDKFGNLWVLQIGSGNDADPVIHCLTADKVGMETVASDWKGFVIPGFTTNFRDGIITMAQQTNTIILSEGKWCKNFIIINTKGTATLDDDTFVKVDNFIDQDNRNVSYYHVTAGIEDKKGRVWIGTDNGVFEITDPSKITSSTALVNHLKVPRNDGTNLADYLLDAQLVSSMAVDSSNRKWIATKGSGVYLVSENGDAILEHYTSDNSILPDNNVYSVTCDPNSNKVYFGTEYGLLEYNSTSSPGKADYSEVYAYPNPVRPDYTGWITIANLMENSLVKIADAAGNVVHQGRSDGGMFTWDGCNSQGERVRSGVYYVMASQNASGSNSGAVTKIMVIN